MRVCAIVKKVDDLIVVLCSELIRNHTLKFLSKALPILKADDSLPKVAKIQPFSQNS